MRMPLTAAGRAASGTAVTGTTAAGSAAAGTAAGETQARETAAGGSASARAAAGEDRPGRRSGRAARHAGRLAALARRHWLATALIAAGTVLRILAQLAYRPALLYIDTPKYLANAWPGADPVGYKAPLRVILLAGNLSTVAAVQHLLGLAMAAALYILLRRRGVPRVLAALAIAPVLLDAYQLQIEQTIMPDVWFEALIVAGLAVLLWKPAITLPAAITAGLILGSSATVRQVGEILILPALIYLLAASAARRATWRQATTAAAALCAAFALPILAYSTGSYALTGQFALSNSGSSLTYARMAQVADCATLRVPAAERPLCPTSAQQALGADWLDHDAASPLKHYVTPPGLRRSKLISDFSHRVLAQQPLAVLTGIGRDALKLFAVSRATGAGDTPITRWEFQTTYPVYRPAIGETSSHVLILGLRQSFDTPVVAQPLSPSLGGRASVSRPLAAFLRSYQLGGGYTPGPLEAIAALAGLAGSLALLRRRASPAQRQLSLACLLFFSTAAAVLLASDIFEFTWRYQLPALVTLPPAGALGISVLLRSATRRASGRRAGSAGHAPELAASSQ